MTAIPAEPQAHGVYIDAQPGAATIRIEGHALPPESVTGYVLQHDINGALPTLILHTRQATGTAFNGLARVAVGIPTSTADIITDFLQQIDPAALEDAALNRDDLGNNKYDLTRAMLRQLADQAQEAM